MCNPSPAIQCVIPLLTLHVDALWILTQDLIESITCGEEFQLSELPHLLMFNALPGQG